MAAPMGHENVRIRVRFALPSSTSSPVFKNRWTLILYDECPTMRDVAKKILVDLNHYERDQFLKLCPEAESNGFLEQNTLSASNRSRSNCQAGVESSPYGNDSKHNSSYTFVSRSSAICCQIYLDGLWLPGFEKSRILRDKDEITLQVQVWADSGARITSSQIQLSERENGYELVENYGYVEGASGDSCKRKSDGSNEENSSEPKKQRLSSETNLAARDCKDPSKTEELKDLQNRRKSQENLFTNDSCSESSPLDIQDRSLVHKKVSKAKMQEKIEENLGAVEIDKDLVSKELKHDSAKKSDWKSKQKGAKNSAGDKSKLKIKHNINDKGDGKIEQSSDTEVKEMGAKKSESEIVWNDSTQRYMQSLINSKIRQLQAQSIKKKDVEPARKEMSAEKSCDKNKMTMASDLSKETVDRTTEDAFIYMRSKLYPESKVASVGSTSQINKCSDDQRSQSRVDLDATGQEPKVNGDHVTESEERVALLNPEHCQIETDPPQFKSPVAQRPGQDQLPLKKKRKRKKKASAKRTPEISQPNVAVARDYSLRLPQHLKPPTNNRVIFHDNDEDGVDDIDEYCARADNSHYAISSPSSSIDGGLNTTNRRQRQGQVAVNGESSCLNESLCSQASSSSFVSSDEKFESLLAANRYHKADSLDMDADMEVEMTRRKPLTKTVWPTSSADGNRCVIQRNATKNKADIELLVEKDDLANQVLGMRLTTQRDESSDQPQENGVDVSKVAKQLMAAVASPKPSSSTNLKMLSTQDRKRVPSGKIMQPNKATTVPTRKEVEQGVGILPEVATHYSDLSTYPLMTSPPERGDTIAYKVLEMSDFYTPVMSSYKKALVLEVGMQDRLTKLELYNDLAEKKREGRFELAEDDDDEPDEDSPRRHLASYDWLAMSDTRLIHRP